MKFFGFVAIATLFLLGCAHQQASAEPQRASLALVEQGRRLANENCASCHAIGRTGASPNPSAPPWRTLSESYPIDSLEEAFAEGIVVGHTAMPEFQLTPSQIEALTNYMRSIQSHPRAPEGE